MNIGDELQTAWGTECIQETDKRPFWNKEHQSDPDYTDPRNGLSNTRKLWQDASWSYVNSETGKMLDQYNYARYNCMLRNRDLRKRDNRSGRSAMVPSCHRPTYRPMDRRKLL